MKIIHFERNSSAFFFKAINFTLSGWLSVSQILEIQEVLSWNTFISYFMIEIWRHSYRGIIICSIKGKRPTLSRLPVTWKSWWQCFSRVSTSFGTRPFLGFLFCLISCTTADRKLSFAATIAPRSLIVYNCFQFPPKPLLCTTEQTIKIFDEQFYDLLFWIWYIPVEIFQQLKWKSLMNVSYILYY